MAPVRNQQIDEEHVGRRLDNYLLSMFKDIPKSHIYQLIRSGQVRVNSGRAKPLQRLNMNDCVRIPPVRIKSPKKLSLTLNALEKQRIESAVLHEDRDWLVLNKPAGLATHSGTRCDLGLAEMLKRLYSGKNTPVPAHRLDRHTSGCLVFAKNRQALLALHEVFRTAAVEKTYLALLVGSWTSALQTVSAPLLEQRGHSAGRVFVNEREGRPATTDFELVTEFKDCILVKVSPRTGRMHQIRVHAAYNGCPVAGDSRYGDFQANRCLQKLGLRRMFLHAEKVSFLYQGQTLSFTAPLAEDLIVFLQQLT